MKIKIARYYVCRDCGKKTQTSLGFPAEWMLILIAKTDQWEVLCPIHHRPMPAVSWAENSTTTNTANYKFVDERWGEKPKFIDEQGSPKYNPSYEPHLKKDDNPIQEDEG